MSIRFRACLRNPTSLRGAGIAGLSFVTNLFLLLVDFLAPRQNPYVGILTYLLLPGITLGSLGLTLAGALVQYSRLRRGLQVVELPRLDLNIPRHRVALGVTFLLVIGFLGLSGVRGYQAYKFTDSVEFCGEVCHTVMQPVFTAYQGSPHARVTCVACHIGPGAEWFVRAKLSGAYQVYSVLFDKFPRPIPTPIRNLRPAQDTCEQCHWPAKFWGERLATRIHFASDEQNTRREIQLLMKIGGGPQKGLTEGIHWHMNIANRIWYIATDDRRLTIPWVRMEDPQGRITEFASTELPVTPGEIEQGEIRLMDCMDCHNRPSHHYLPPGTALDLSLLAGLSGPHRAQGIPGMLPVPRREARRQRRPGHPARLRDLSRLPGATARRPGPRPGHARLRPSLEPGWPPRRDRLYRLPHGGTGQPATCRGCHGIATSGAPMAGMECRECHLKDQRRLPVAECQACHSASQRLHAIAMHAAAGCAACHTPHAWSPDPRQPCLTCHADMAEHNPGPPCAECHSFR